MDSIYLKKSKESRIISGYPWIFADDITSLPVIRSNEVGSIFKVCDHRGKFIAIAYTDSNDKLVARVIAKDLFKELDKEFFIEKISDAKDRRHNIQSNYFRLCNSEGDFLPGLIIDRFDDVFSIKFTTDGLFRYKKHIVEALEEVYKVKGILIRHRDQQIEIGIVPENITVKENDVSFICDIKKGQKTGWYFDQRQNHQLIAKLAKGKTVLDAFCYDGGFGIHAAKAGATHVTFIDSSSLAVEYCIKNAQLNNCVTQCEFIVDDAMDAMFRLHKKFDIVVLDPPPFIKAKQDKAAGIKGYRKLLESAVEVLNSQGYLFFATCSHHMLMSDLINLIKWFPGLEIISKYGAASDHPAHPQVPQTRYLNAILARLIN